VPRLLGDVMDRRRVVWLVLWPAVSVLAAVVVGVAAIAAASVLVEPDGADDAQGIRLLLDRAVLSGEAHLADLTRSPATLVAVVLVALAWLVTLGVGAQRYFPSRRRLAPAVLAVALTGVLSFAAVNLGAGRDAGELVTLGQLAPVAATSALVAGVVVFLLTGHRWKTAAPRHHREPPVYAHLADLL